MLSVCTLGDFCITIITEKCHESWLWFKARSPKKYLGQLQHIYDIVNSNNTVCLDVIHSHVKKKMEIYFHDLFHTLLFFNSFRSSMNFSGELPLSSVYG